MELHIHTFDLPLKHTFTITHESRDVQPTLIVELTWHGKSGYGEATETPYYGVTMEKMISQLESIRNLLPSDILPHPNDFWKMMSKTLLDDHPFALCALDVAYWDLWGKTHDKALYQLWGLDISHNPITDYTIGMDTIEVMVSKMKEMPFPLYKIKLGTNQDIEIIKALRKETDAVFRVDANTAWTVEQTLEFAPKLQALGVEFIEQPLKADQWEGMKRLKKESALPIIADESCITESDVAQCAEYFHGINIKLMKCGGITPALRMIQQGRNMGLKIMVGCMTESTIGCSAIAQLLPLLDYVDMDGCLLVEDKISQGIRIDFGHVIYAKEGGTGAKLIQHG
ncbi:dipeptide epimerase [Aquirufa aurantiipilula]|uniref:dipeptide epimerase n=1 Tax=Aquirufa aurantiipilula TaxID=2696561 RepID=UPI001CAA7D3A|nr:dipeptide epimerase [Aquirufa aurantiipilula]MBZ1327170.1 dipeptide epimerase [Aquirufa aurantiipilula]